MSTATKVRENRSRRAAARQGLKLSKYGTRDPRALTYGKWSLWKIDPNGTGGLGALVADRLSLDEVEERLGTAPDADDDPDPFAGGRVVCLGWRSEG